MFGRDTGVAATRERQEVVAPSARSINRSKSSCSALVSDTEPFELGREPNVGVESGCVLVEVQERLRAPIKDAPTALDEPVQFAQTDQQGLEFTESGGLAWRTATR